MTRDTEETGMNHKTKVWVTVRAKGYHTASCSCGWVSADQLTLQEATDDAAAHVAEHAPPQEPDA